LEAFEAAENPVDEEFVGDLRRIITRTRVELDAIRRAADATGTRQDSG
jgi:hypothetical protein